MNYMNNPIERLCQNLLALSALLDLCELYFHWQNLCSYNAIASFKLMHMDT